MLLYPQFTFVFSYLHLKYCTHTGGSNTTTHTQVHTHQRTRMRTQAQERGREEGGKGERVSRRTRYEARDHPHKHCTMKSNHHTNHKNNNNDNENNDTTTTTNTNEALNNNNISFHKQKEFIAQLVTSCMHDHSRINKC